MHEPDRAGPPAPRSHGPPRARLAFRVGVVGHRPDRLPSAPADLAGLRRRLGFVLELVKAQVEAVAAGDDAALYHSDQPILTAVSPLAEGVDRLFAATALDAGYALTAPMPFLRAEFEQDFTARPPDGTEDSSASLEEFQAILARAEAGAGLRRFELDGRREDEEGAYGAAGRVVLNQSDLLIVVWDGGPARGRGGTLETLREAVEFQVPVLWIEPWPPFAWAVLRSDDDLAFLEPEGRASPPWPWADDAAGDEQALAAAVAQIVQAELGSPRGEAVETDLGRTLRSAKESRTRALAYFAERQPRIDAFVLWKLFRDLVGDGRVRVPRLRVGDFTADPPPEWSGQEPASLSRLVGRLWPHFAFADRLADYYADAHRSGFIATALLAAGAVFAALIPVALGVTSGGHRSADLAFIAAEGLILILLSATLWVARRGGWHERWLEYRMLAEWIRQLRFLIPLGGGRPLPRSQAHLTVYGEPTLSWMYWQVRAIAREAGLPSVVCDLAYIRGRLDHLRATIGDAAGGQIGFHRISAERSERIHRRLHAVTSTLVVVTIGAVALNFAVRAGAGPSLAGVTERTGAVLIMLCAGLPALSAALASINNLGEFAHMAKRSRAMRQAFEALKVEVDALERRSGGARRAGMSEVAQLASRMAAVMVEEGVDWRVVMLELPHSAE